MIPPDPAISSGVKNPAQPSRMLIPDTLGNGLPLYMYTLDHAAVGLEAGVCYFIEVRNNGGDADEEGCHWNWAYAADVPSPPDWNYSVFWLGPDGMTYDQMGAPVNSHNLSLGLSIEFVREDPATPCNLQ